MDLSDKSEEGQHGPSGDPDDSEDPEDSDKQDEEDPDEYSDEDSDKQDEENDESDSPDSEHESDSPKSEHAEADEEDDKEISSELEQEGPSHPVPAPPRHEIIDRYRGSLSHALKSGVRAFFGALDSGQHLGTHANLQGIRQAAQSGDIDRIVQKLNPPDDNARGTLHKTIKALMPLAKLAAVTTLGVTATVATGTMIPALLAAYYVNRHLDMGSMSSDRLRSMSSSDECDRLVNSFMDWVEGLNANKIASASACLSTSADYDIKACPVQALYGSGDTKRYVVTSKDGKLRGIIQWDKKYGAPNTEANGWNVILMDGFNESSWQSGRDSTNLEPYTTVFRGDVVLVNPARMPFSFARDWAIAALRR